MIKFNGSISFLVTQRCKICGKTYEGDSEVVMRKSIVHRSQYFSLPRTRKAANTAC